MRHTSPKPIKAMRVIRLAVAAMPKAKKLLPKRIEEDAKLQKKNTAAEKNILDRKVLNACHGKSFGFAFLPAAWVISLTGFVSALSLI